MSIDKQCHKCHTSLRQNAHFCSQCGSKQENEQPPPWEIPLFPDLPIPSHTTAEVPWASLNHTRQENQTLLTPELREQLLDCFRNNQFEHLDEIVRKISRYGHDKLSVTLTPVLFDQTLKELQQPHGSFGHYPPDKFPQAKDLIISENPALRKEGLELFRQIKSNRAFRSHPLVDEWTLFAEALVHGPIQAFPDWKKKWIRGDASWEEIWNLAVFYVQQSDFKQALEVLQPSLNKRKAPFAHLRFALYSAIQLLGQKDITPDARNTAIDFLSKNLSIWPTPECYLAWMGLERGKQQEQIQDRDDQSIKKWRTLYNLLVEQITIPNLEKRPNKEQARAFVKQLQRLDLVETLILWLRDFTKHYCAQFSKKERLSSFEEFDFEMWQALSEAYDHANENMQAGDILFKLALEQQKIFQKQRANSSKVPGAAFWHMRECLIKLFQHYQRNNFLNRHIAIERCILFYKAIPELWDKKESRNEELIRVTRPLLEQIQQKPEFAWTPQAEKPSSPPRLQVQVTSPDTGLPWKHGEAALDISVYNPGPGKVTKVRITCPSTENTMIRLKNEVGLDDLEEDQTRLVSVPVIVNPPADEAQLKCRIDLVYHWEWDREKRSTSHWLQVKLVNSHHLPNPYVFDRPLGSLPQDALLFQGREKELDMVRESFLKQQGKGDPLYFCGMPKIGKTSLLNHLALMLKDSGEFVPCVVNLKGIQATQQSLGEVIALLTQCILRDARNAGLNVSAIKPISADDQDPIRSHRTWYFFQGFLQQNRFQPHTRLILLLDGFDLLIAPHTKELLDLLAALQEYASTLFILSGHQRPENLSPVCRQTRFFPLTGHSLDLFSFSTIKQILEKPLADHGVQIPEVTIEQMLLHTAGHPYLVALVAYQAVEQLNTKQRMVLTPQDIDEIIRQSMPQLADKGSLFHSSFFAMPQEQDAVIRFARKASEKGGMLPVNEAQRILGENLMRSLWEKYALEYIHSKIHGGCMCLHDQIQLCLLGNRQTSVVRKRVGLFVDYENVLPSARGMSAREMGDALIRYAARFGDVICCWASADPRNNLGNGTRFKGELEQAGFQVQFPCDESSKSRKNASDFVLIRLIGEERIATKPDMYVIVSGDGDYHECIDSLIKSGATVHLCASSSRGHPAKMYFTLAEERRHHRQAQGLESDFIIDDLDTVLSGKSC